MKLLEVVWEINWRALPFVRPLLGFVAGLLFGRSWPLQWPESVLLWVSLALLLSAFFMLGMQQYKNRWHYGFFMVLFFFFIGMYHQATYPDHRRADFIGKLQPEKGEMLLVEILEPLQLTVSGKSFRATGRCVRLGEKACRGKVLIYFSLADLHFVEVGDLLLVPAIFREIPPVHNPYAFDYRAYMAGKQIHFQLFLKEGAYLQVGQVHRWRHRLLAFRQKLLRVLEKYFHDRDALAVVSAMVLGDRQQMSFELKESYARTGAMHVLAVSGLHMGLIYFFFVWVFEKLIVRLKHYRGLHFFLGLVALWGFAFLTGASPSVLRAATLFSFLLAGKWINERPATLNSLAASAFCLLWYNPLWLNDLSFQLSYAAVVGIVLLRRDIYLAYLPANPFLLRAWKLSSVSIAAQLGTAPLGLYYFHRFSNGFWLSSLLVVPAAPFVLLGGLLLLLVDTWFPSLAPLLGSGLEALVVFVNRSLSIVGQIPGQSIEGIFISPLQLAMLYAVVLSFVFALKFRSGRYLLYGMALLIVVQSISGFRQIRLYREPVLISYKLKRNQFLLDAVAGGQRLSIFSGKISPDEERFAAEGFRRYLQVNRGVAFSLSANDSLYLNRLAWRKPFLQVDTMLVAVLRKGEHLPLGISVDTLFRLEQ